MKRKWKLGLITLSFVLVLVRCGSLSGLSVNGLVVEQATGKPIANAIVVVTWHGHSSAGLVDGQSVCYHVETVIANDHGEFHTKAWTDGLSASAMFISDREVDKIVFSPGFVMVRDGISTSEDKVFLTPAVQDEKYLSKMVDLARRSICAGGGAGRKNQSLLYRPLTVHMWPVARKLGDPKIMRLFIGLRDEFDENPEPLTTETADKCQHCGPRYRPAE